MTDAVIRWLIREIADLLAGRKLAQLSPDEFVRYAVLDSRIETLLAEADAEGRA